MKKNGIDVIKLLLVKKPTKKTNKNQNTKPQTKTKLKQGIWKI